MPCRLVHLGNKAHPERHRTPYLLKNNGANIFNTSSPVTFIFMLPLLMIQITPQPEYNIHSLVNEMYMGRRSVLYLCMPCRSSKNLKDAFFHWEVHTKNEPLHYERHSQIMQKEYKCQSYPADAGTHKPLQNWDVKPWRLMISQQAFSSKRSNWLHMQQQPVTQTIKLINRFV